MNAKLMLQQDEKALSTLTGLIESFNGTQNFFFGDLYLTNKRLYIVSDKLINLEESWWFEGEMSGAEHATFIVGEHRITIRWTYKGNLPAFKKAFHKLCVSA